MDGIEWLKKLDLQRWWNLAAAIGVVVVLPAIAIQDHAIATVGFGIMACGFGERFNHRMEMSFLNGGMLTTYERTNRPQGVALVVLGVILIAFGLIRLSAN
jgi:hypothetical protein